MKGSDFAEACERLSSSAHRKDMELLFGQENLYPPQELPPPSDTVAAIMNGLNRGFKESQMYRWAKVWNKAKKE